MKSDFWVYESEAPASSGWYPVLICYDEQEGIFPNALRSDGKNWAQKLPVIARGNTARPFSTEKDAHDWAYAHDPDAPNS